jgi:hypothetical protein
MTTVVRFGYSGVTARRDAPGPGIVRKWKRKPGLVALNTGNHVLLPSAPSCRNVEFHRASSKPAVETAHFNPC